MHHRLEKWRDWYRHRDQEFLRREVDWTLRWFLRPRGLIWFVLGLLIVVLPSLFLSTDPTLVLQSPRSGIVLLVSFFYLLQVYSLWLSHVQKRAIAPLQKERFRDLFLTNVRPADLWPGLLAAPVISYCVLKIIPTVIAYIISIFRGTLAESYLTTITRLAPTIYWLDPLVPIFAYMTPFVFCVSSVAWIAGLTAFVVKRVLPESGYFAVGFYTVVGGIVIYLPALGLSIGAAILQLIWTFASAKSGGGFAPSMQTMLFVQFVLSPTATFLMSIAVFVWSLRSLRSEKFWNKLRARAEKF